MAAGPEAPGVVGDSTAGETRHDRYGGRVDQLCT